MKDYSRRGLNWVFWMILQILKISLEIYDGVKLFDKNTFHKLKTSATEDETHENICS